MVYYPSISIKQDIGFKLRSPTKGQLKLKKLYSAYDKNSLSSIPNNYEIYLINKSNCTSPIIGQDIEKEINIIMNKENNYSLNQISELNHVSLKGYGNGFASKLDRFDISKENNDKYSPGPGEYKINHYNNRRNNLRYKSLFNEPFQLKTTKKTEDKLGPGFYDSKIESCVVKNAKILNSAFSSQDIRFKELKRKKIGPGSYEQAEISKWNKKIPSFFFKTPLITKINNIEKYINTRGINKHKTDVTPGPGQYIQKSEFDKCITDTKCLKKAMSYSYLISNQDNTLVPKELKEFNLLMQEELNIRNNINLMDKINKELSLNGNQNERKTSKGIRSPFLSNSKKCIIYDNTTNHIPGPCYYQREINYYNQLDRKNAIRK